MESRFGVMFAYAVEGLRGLMAIPLMVIQIERGCLTLSWTNWSLKSYALAHHTVDNSRYEIYI